MNSVPPRTETALCANCGRAETSLIHHDFDLMSYHGFVSASPESGPTTCEACAGTGYAKGCTCGLVDDSAPPDARGGETTEPELVRLICALRNAASERNKSRLNAAQSRLYQHVADIHSELSRLRAEHERLREAAEECISAANAWDAEKVQVISFDAAKTSRWVAASERLRCAFTDIATALYSEPATIGAATGGHDG